MTGDQESWARHRKVWRLAIPIILANLSVPLLGAVDTAVLGHLPHPRFLGGVAVANAIFMFVYWGFGFLRMGTTGLAAQAHGAHADGSQDGGETRAVLARALLFALALGLLLWTLRLPILSLSLDLFQASPETEAEARIYYLIRVWSAPAALANYCLLGWFIGVQNTRAALVLQVLMNG
ncbi:MAG: MATE family efflux transporter, partial [Rhodospirillales bacterium]|nr:MATE family efflux transporter [Rhodospirillales bacterium]